MKNNAIVAIGYNRPLCMKRLLRALIDVNYLGDSIDLIISLDNSGNDSVEKVAYEFEWPYGEKIIKTYKNRMGLRNHVLECGKLTNNYNFIAVFEDDIYPSPGFYNYAKQAVEFYKDKDDIAGISLYKHLWQEGCGRPFIPVEDRFDVYLMQYAPSWGQIWTKEKWMPFYKWYLENMNKSLESSDMPKHVSSWPKSSWLKYHIKYLIETNKYFVYPRCSLSTNFSEVGQHAKINLSHYQVPFQIDANKVYKFGAVNELVKYDAYFENIGISHYFNLNESELIVDLYNMKQEYNKRYVLTSKIENYKIIKKYACKLRPHEMNVIYDIYGDEIYLYDTNYYEKNNGKTDLDISKTSYDIRGIDKRRLLKLSVYLYKDALYRKIKGRFDHK